MAATNAPCILFLLLVCFLQAYLSQHASVLRECHCRSGCDGDFRCSSGCLMGWSGPTCQIPSVLRECHCRSGCDGDFRCSSGCLMGWSGPTCQIPSVLRECHCRSGCDGDFRCSSGCLTGWSGPTCQIHNIALNKTTQQSSTLNDCAWAYTEAMRKVCGDKTSSLAVDGVVSSRYWSGTCTHTLSGRRSAWWTVDLGETHLITSLRIFFSNPSK
ncbi:protein jagged-2-like [Haliotis asinina]|uniref:protein jagged-2-like n=1 Tax=Haliotis asinina TaxID=109174 RepID=UPI003531A558